MTGIILHDVHPYPLIPVDTICPFDMSIGYIGSFLFGPNGHTGHIGFKEHILANGYQKQWNKLHSIWTHCQLVFIWRSVSIGHIVPSVHIKFSGLNPIDVMEVNCQRAFVTYMSNVSNVYNPSVFTEPDVSNGSNGSIGPNVSHRPLDHSHQIDKLQN